MDLEDRMVTATPEGVSAEVVLAGAGSRFGAILLDTLLQLVILVPLFFVATAIGNGFHSTTVVVGLDSIMILLDFFGYFVLLEMLTGGRTLGKMAAGLRAVRLDVRPVGFLTSLVRTVLRVIDYLILGIVGMAFMVATPRNQRLGDLAAGTVVVRERRAASTRRVQMNYAQPTWSTATPGVPGHDVAPAPVPVLSAYAEPLDARGWDVTAVAPEQLVVAERFLRSRFGYMPAARARLAARLANLLAPSVAGAPTDLPAERFLEGVVAAKVGGGWAVPARFPAPVAPPPYPPPTQPG